MDNLQVRDADPELSLTELVFGSENSVFLMNWIHGVRVGPIRFICYPLY